MRVNWLCQCGNGLLAVEENDLPEFCMVCGFPVEAIEPDEDLVVADTCTQKECICHPKRTGGNYG